MGRPSFVDRVEVLVRAGAGGNGCISFRREKFVPKGGPNGGDGGCGGAVRFLVDPNVTTLIALKFKPQQQAERGEHGQGKSRHGRSAPDLVVRVPAGTEVRDRDTGELLFDLVAPGQDALVARGGKGGRGNERFATSMVQAPRHAEPGAPGEERRLVVLLKIVADAGLVGHPNAGKSTLLGAISAAHPKVAPYPFTTLHPVIGTVAFPDLVSYTVADIPGLVAGAHRNVGLGHEFLRHIERTRLLIYLLDMAGTDGRDPAGDFITLQEELALHSLALAGKPSLVVGNKIDMPAARENRERLRDVLPKDTIWIAAKTGAGLDEFRMRLRQVLDHSSGGEPGTVAAALPRDEQAEQEEQQQ